MNRVLFLLGMLVLVVSGVRAQDSVRNNASNPLTWDRYTISDEEFSQIRFEPAMKDGKPVSMYMMLEYHFN